MIMGSTEVLRKIYRARLFASILSNKIRPASERERASVVLKWNSASAELKLMILFRCATALHQSRAVSESDVVVHTLCPWSCKSQFAFQCIKFKTEANNVNAAEKNLDHGEFFETNFTYKWWSISENKNVNATVLIFFYDFYAPRWVFAGRTAPPAAGGRRTSSCRPRKWAWSSLKFFPNFD